MKLTAALSQSVLTQDSAVRTRGHFTNHRLGKSTGVLTFDRPGDGQEDWTGANYGQRLTTSFSYTTKKPLAPRAMCW